MKRAFTYRGEPVSLVAFAVCIFVSLGGFIFGYDIGYISGCLIMPPFVAAYGTADPSSTTGGLYLSDDRQALITAILSAGSFTGALLGVPTADFLGRRGAIFFAAMVFIAGVIVQIAPYQIYGAFLAGRFIAGAAVGALSALVPLYQGEISPKSLRGGFTSLYQLMITIGILLAYCVDYGTKDLTNSASYRIPIGLQCAWGLILAAGTPFLPKSPRESVLNGHPDNARKTIATMHAVALHHPLVEYTVKEIEDKIAEERGSGSGYLDCFNFKNELQTGRRTVIGMCVQSFQQLTGANFIFYYGTTIFQNYALDSYVSQIIFGTLDVVGTVPGLYCLDRFGRRRTMITGALVMGLSYMLYGVLGSYALFPNNDPNATTQNKSTGAAIIFVICVFVLAYGCSWGPGGWVNTGEIAPLRTKAKQLSFVAASNWTWNFLLSYFSPFIASTIYAKYGFVFFGANFLAALFVYLFVPEMSGLSLEEINLLFQQRIPARKSIVWNREVRARDHGFNTHQKDIANVTSADRNVEVSPHANGEKNKTVAQHVDSGRVSDSTAV